MVDKITKRDGREEKFDRNKIMVAISKANGEVEKERQIQEYKINAISEIVEHLISSGDVSPNVESIQDAVENEIMSFGYHDVARAYIKYRYLHTMARDRYQDLMDAVEEKLTARDVKNQNANVDEKSFGGRIGEASSVVTKRFALENIVSKMARDNHEGNRIYIHDLDAYAIGSHNCLSVPFDDLLARGFNTRQTDVRSAQSVSTAFQLVAVIFQLQSLQQFGGVSATHLDWTMVPYVRKSFFKHFKDGLRFVENYHIVGGSSYNGDMSIDDKKYKDHKKAFEYATEMTEKEVYQAAEGMFHNLKMLGRLNSNIENIAV